MTNRAEHNRTEKRPERDDVAVIAEHLLRHAITIIAAAQEAFVGDLRDHYNRRRTRKSYGWREINVEMFFPYDFRVYDFTESELSSANHRPADRPLRRLERGPLQEESREHFGEDARHEGDDQAFPEQVHTTAGEHIGYGDGEPDGSGEEQADQPCAEGGHGVVPDGHGVRHHAEEHASAESAEELGADERADLAEGGDRDEHNDQVHFVPDLEVLLRVDGDHVEQIVGDFGHDFGGESGAASEE